jgi:hypothetical protein
MLLLLVHALHLLHTRGTHSSCPAGCVCVFARPRRALYSGTGGSESVTLCSCCCYRCHAGLTVAAVSHRGFALCRTCQHSLSSCCHKCRRDCSCCGATVYWGPARNVQDMHTTVTARHTAGVLSSAAADLLQGLNGCQCRQVWVSGRGNLTTLPTASPLDWKVNRVRA